MANLQLKLVSGGNPGQSQTYQFSSAGGTVGRSSHCDWTLIDPDRFISNTHMQIAFRDNQFMLIDVSSNGVFVNGSNSPLGKHNFHILSQNDTILIGKFNLIVEHIDIGVSPVNRNSDLLNLVSGAPGSNNEQPQPNIFSSNDSEIGKAPVNSTFSSESNISQNTGENKSPGENLGLFDILSQDESQLSQSPADNPFTPKTSASETFDSPFKNESINQFDKQQDSFLGTHPSGASQGKDDPSGTIPDDWDLLDDVSDKSSSDIEKNTHFDSFTNSTLDIEDIPTNPNSSDSLIGGDFLDDNSFETKDSPLSAERLSNIQSPPITAPSEDISEKDSIKPSASNDEKSNDALNEQMISKSPNLSNNIDSLEDTLVSKGPIRQTSFEGQNHQNTQTPKNISQNSVNNLTEDSFFDELYEKLGLASEYKSSVDKTQFAQDLADILMTSTQGIMSLLSGRSVFKQESRLNMTMIKPNSNNPIKFTFDPSDTLEMLLVRKKKSYMDAQSAYSEALNDIQLHQMAFLAGLQATLKGIVKELDPTVIEENVNKQTNRFMALKANTQKWDCYREKHDSLYKKINENLNDILSEHFSEAYENQINKIKNKP